MHMREFELALRELLVLRDLAPDEANVWFLLGKCWKGLGEKGEALRAFTTALNLDVKVSLITSCSLSLSHDHQANFATLQASPFIKEAMESLDDDDEMDSDDD
jgi:anaphase-promoting complex subunit 3